MHKKTNLKFITFITTLQIFIFSLKTLAQVNILEPTYDFTGVPFQGFAYRSAGNFDFNGDGFSDFAFNSLNLSLPDFGNVEIYSGINGSYLFGIEGSQTAEDFGRSLTGISDLNDDGGVNLADSIYILNHLFVIGASSIPEPYPNSGFDPTPDTL